MPLLVLARTFNQGADGTFGQSIPGDPRDCLLDEGDVGALSGVVGGDFRSNALFFNGGGGSTELDLTLVSRTGAEFGSRSFDLLAGENDQINNVLGFFGAPNSGAPYTLTVEVLDGGPVTTGVSVID